MECPNCHEEGDWEGLCPYCDDLYSIYWKDVEEEELLKRLKTKTGCFVDAHDRSKEREKPK